MDVCRDGKMPSLLVSPSHGLPVPCYAFRGCPAADRERSRGELYPDFCLLGSCGGPAFGRNDEWRMTGCCEADFEKAKLCGYVQEARKRCGQAKSLTKNAMFISEWLTLAHEDGGIVSQSLDNLCKAIIA